MGETNSIEFVNDMEALEEKNILKNPAHGEYYYYINGRDVKERVLRFSARNSFSNDSKELVPKNSKFDFYRCLSYFKNESVAMWSVYAPCGSCIRLTTGVVEKFGENIVSFEFHLKDGGAIKKEKSEVKSFTFCKKHVIYYSDNGNDDIYIKRSTHHAHIHSDLFKELQNDGILKDICWDYECELRLCLSFDYEELKIAKEDIDHIDVEFKCQANQIQYFKTPFEVKNQKSEYSSKFFENSKLKNVRISVNENFQVSHNNSSKKEGKQSKENLCNKI